MGQHLIHTQRLDLRYRNSVQAKADMDQWSKWYHREFLPVISEVLDELEIPGKTMRLNKLEIDLGRISGKPDPDHLKRILKEELKNQLLQQFPELLKTSKSPSWIETSSPSVTRDQPNELEHLAYLLEKGRQPWWALPSKKAGIRYLFQKLVEEKNPVFKSWMESQPLSLTGAQRLANHLSLASLEELISWIFPDSIGIWKLFAKSLEESLSPLVFSKTELVGILSEILTEAFLVKKSTQVSATGTWLRTKLLFSPSPRINSKELLLPILELISEKKSQVPKTSASTKILEKWLVSAFARRYSEYWPSLEKKEKDRIFGDFQKELLLRLGQKAAAQKVEKTQIPEKFRQSSSLETEETIPVFNAGLVLTAPFLIYFFRGLGLVEHKEFVSKSAQHRAALLIQALLDERFVYEESDLLLNKILCGIPPDEPIPVSFSPTETEKEEIKNLLEAMVSQWTALKSTSGESMAKGFFPREGSLKRVSKGYQLTIPRISIDILLNRLPWAISIIKLPWMEETLFTEW